MKILFLILLQALALSACHSGKDSAQQELWIYTSLYKDTIADLNPKLEKAFPGVKFNWYQAGSEEVATKVNAEILAGNLQADVLISSDRFWYEELGMNGKLHPYKVKAAEAVPSELKNPQDFYTAVSLPVMVLCYNNESVSDAEAPKSFKEMGEARWKGKFTIGSPLASGTNFTTMAMLQQRYGWDYFKGLKANDTISEGGNSSVLRRIQNKERPVGWVLLENVLRFQESDKRLKAVFPEDGVVTQANVLAISNKAGSRELAEKFAEWMFGEEGQAAMTRSFMYSTLPSFAPPVGAPAFAEMMKSSFPWSQDFIKQVTSTRNELKEKYTEIMFQ